MSGSLNRATLIGHLGRDPEIKTTTAGKKIATFSIATGEKWRDKNTGEDREVTDWHNIVVFNEQIAGIVERFVTKGSRILVEGQLKTRKYQKDGSDRYSTEIVLQGFDCKLLLLSAKGETTSNRAPPPGEDDYGGSRSTGSARPAAKDDFDDTIPF